MADLDELERLHAAATPAPWDWAGECLGHEHGDDRHRDCILHASVWTEHDEAIICAARNALPQLIAAARELAKLKARRCDNCAFGAPVDGPTWPGEEVACDMLGELCALGWGCKDWRART